MSTPKGWPSKNKDNRLKNEYSTVQPIGVNRYGLDVIGNIGSFLVVADAVDSISSDGYTITAAAHSARPGDTVRFTSGSAIYVETRVVETTTNTIVLADTFKWDLAGYLPAAGDTFQILRPRSVIVDEVTGSVVTAPISTGPVQFTRNAATQTVTEDTAAIANNRALPVKIINDVSETIYNDYSSTAVTTGAWVQLVAATAQKAVKLQIFDSSGEVLELGTGAAAAETRKLLITPGGNGSIDVQIAAGTRLSVRAVSANASTGLLAINVIRE